MKTIVRADAILFAGVLLGLGVNAVSPESMPLTPQTRPTDRPPAEFDPFAPPEGYLSLDDLREAFETGSATIVDARTEEEYEAGHIPGAVSAPSGEFSAGRPVALDQAPKQKPVIVYCEGKDCGASLIVAEQLRLYGYKDVRVFVGGFMFWQQMGFEVAYGNE